MLSRLRCASLTCSTCAHRATRPPHRSIHTVHRFTSVTHTPLATTRTGLRNCIVSPSAAGSIVPSSSSAASLPSSSSISTRSFSRRSRPAALVRDTDSWRYMACLPARFHRRTDSDSPSASSTSTTAGFEYLTSGRDAWFRDPSIGVTLHRYLRDMHRALSSNNPTRVFTIFQTMQKDTTIPALHTEVFNCLLRACVMLKQPDSAVSTYDAIYQHGLQPNFMTYMHLVEALLQQSSIPLAFDFLVLAHQEYQSAYNAATHPSSSLTSEQLTTCVRFMDSTLLTLHCHFLRKTSLISVGYHNNIWKPIRRMEVFVKKFMYQKVEEMKGAIARIVVQRRREIGATASGASSSNTSDLVAQDDIRSLVSSLFQRDSPSHTRFHDIASFFASRRLDLTPADLMHLSPLWKKMHEIYYDLIGWSVTRRDYEYTSILYDELTDLRAIPELDQLVLNESTVLEKNDLLHHNISLLHALSRVYHDIDDIPCEDELLEEHENELDAELYTGDARLSEVRESNNPNKEHRKRRTVDDFIQLRNRHYEIFWNDLRSYLRSRSKSLSGILNDEESSSLFTQQRLQFQYRSYAGVDETLQVIPQSKFIERLRIHKNEPRDDAGLSGLVKKLHPNSLPVKQGLTPRTSAQPQQATGDISIDSLVNNLFQKNLTLQQKEKSGLISHEQAMLDIEGGPTVSEKEDEMEQQMEREYSEDESGEVREINEIEEEERMMMEKDGDGDGADVNNETSAQRIALEQQLAQQQREDELEQFNLEAESHDRKMAPFPPTHGSWTAAKRVIESPLTKRARTSSSILPPHAPSLLPPIAVKSLNHLYKTMLSSLLLHGAGTSSGKITHTSYRRNIELIHALYYDYLSLNLPSPDPSILMLAHISHAPPEFHSKLIHDSEWLGAKNTSSAGLVMNLFSPYLVMPPRTASTRGLGKLASQIQRLHWFRRVWNTMHVHEHAHIARGSDLAFRKRTYRLIEELTRNGLSTVNARDDMLYFIIKCLSFTSYSSRPDGAELQAQSFHWRRMNLYEQDILHVRRILRILFNMIHVRGINPDVKTMNEIIAACLSHKRLVEAHTVLQHMRHTFHLIPDINTLNLFLQSKHTPSHLKASQRLLMELERNINEVIQVSPSSVQERLERREEQERRNSLETRLLPQRDGIDIETALSPSQQLLETFNQLLNQYVLSQDSGAGMLRVHERLFELGLKPNSRTLALSLNILLQTPNLVSFGRARELFLCAISPAPKKLDPTGYLMSFLQSMEEGRASAKEETRRRRERQAEIRKMKERKAGLDEATSTSALTSTDSSLTIDDDATDSPDDQPLTYDPLLSPTHHNYAISFSYSSWCSTHVTSRSWKILFESTLALGSWQDAWMLYVEWMKWNATLSENDPRASFYLSNAKLKIYAALLKTLIHSTNHMEFNMRLWYFRWIYDGIQMSFRYEKGGAMHDRKMMYTRVSMSLQHQHLRQELNQYELNQLLQFEAGLMRGYRQMIPAEEKEEDVKQVFRVMHERRERVESGEASGARLQLKSTSTDLFAKDPALPLSAQA